MSQAINIIIIKPVIISIFLLSAVRHLKKYVTLFAAFTTNFKSELHLLNKIQEYCYDNMNFIKSFNKIVLLLYKSKYIAVFNSTTIK